MNALQLFIAITGGLAIWLANDPRPKWQRYACLFGLASQPGFLFSTATAGQWGMFALAVFYTGAWGRGFWREWVKAGWCWWFGCAPAIDGSEYGAEWQCQQCGETVDFHDIATASRSENFKSWCSYFFYRRWWPEKCDYCGARWRACDETVDHIPF